jgi:hypothetical protein
MNTLSIGQVARRAGVGIETVRFYEREGLLEEPPSRVVGVSMLGVNASEVIHEAAMALRFGATADDFIDMIHVYPTMAEALKIVAISFTKDVS